MKSSIVCFLITVLSLNNAIAQNVASGGQSFSRSLEWSAQNNLASPVLTNHSVSEKMLDGVRLPVITETFETSNRSNIELVETQYEILQGFDKYKADVLKDIKETVYFKVFHTLEGEIIHTGYTLSAYKKSGGQYYRLKSYTIKFVDGPAFSKAPLSSMKRGASNSVLKTGQWLKYSVTGDGVYKITGADLAAAGWNLSGLDPRTIKLYGNHGGMLSEVVKDFRYDDLPENSIRVVGEDDGQMSPSDYILFYAQGPHKLKIDTTEKRLTHVTNIYSDKSFYFITFGGTNGKRISAQSDGQALTPNASFNWFDDVLLHEQDIENICNEGRVVLGEKFDQKLIHTFNHNLSNVTNNRNIRFYYSFGAVSSSGSSMMFKVNNVLLATENVAATFDPKNYCMSYSGTRKNQISPTGSVQLSFQYNQPVVSAKAWLDYYEIQYTRQLKYSESFMSFRNINSARYAVSEFRLTDMPGSGFIWDVSNPVDVKAQSTFTDNQESVFRAGSTGIPRTYILCDGNFASPKLEGSVENQDLHDAGVVQFIIVSPSEFLEAANKLASWHKTRDNMDVKVVTPQQIYNEFSSGSQDISSIRDYFRHVYYQNPNPANGLKYVLFVGDASFDYKDKITNNTNYVPVYEADFNVGAPKNIGGYYCSDDFFGYLDSTDGEWENEQKLEITVSRFPVVSAEEAMNMVEKVINYKKPESLGEWRNFVTFCADDVDEDWETSFVQPQFESIYGYLDTVYSNINVRKVYLDAFKQVNLNGSQRYPDAQQAIKKEFEQGVLMFNYIGHGGPDYLASEKVIDLPLITSMNNKYKLPAFFTATCEFSRFDDAEKKSAGEFLFTQKDGGAIAMFTTTRVVGADPNYQLTYYFWKNCMFVPVNGKWPRIGDMYKKMKNRNDQSTNDRSFSVFADPALILNYPDHKVLIDTIIQEVQSDTIGALSKVRFVGHLENVSAQKLNTFNGTVFPIVYDKPTTFKTLANDIPGTEESFELYSNILYKGESTVKNGDFSFTFVMPKDINYVYGKGRVSLYASSSADNIDASGNNRDFIIGGATENAVSDNKGPQIQLFIDDYNFVSGGLTDQSPLLLAKVFDENGINTSGIGIGRDIIATIDKGTPNEKRYNLNAFYTAKLDSYTSGDIKYQLEGLTEGRHTYTLKVWDVYNNSAEATIEFQVKDNKELQLEQVRNYPNPFSNNTTFMFEHNHAGENITVVVKVYTLNGSLVKTLEETIVDAPGHVELVTWNGQDESDDHPASGVYFYRLEVTTQDGKKAEKTEKMVILN